MAFLDKPKDNQSIASYVIGGSQDPMMKYGRPQMTDPDYSSTDAENNARQKFDEAQNYQSKLRNSATDYRQNLPGTQNALFNQASDVGKRGLAANIVDTRSAASRRGLLNSGIRQGAEASNYRDYLGGMSQARAGINKETNDTASNMENSAIASGVALQQQRQAMEDAIYARQMSQYDQAVKKRDADKGLLGGLGGSLGGALGSAAGSKSGSN